MFWGNEYETPLIAAIVRGDLDSIKALASQKDQVMAENYLGFNAIQMAIYLDKMESLDLLLQSKSQRIYNVKLKGENEVREMKASEFETFFNIRALNHLVFFSYNLLKSVIKACPPYFRVGENLEEKPTQALFEKYVEQPEKFAIFGKLHKDKINRGYFVPVTIEWVEDAVGYGVFAKEDIKRGAFVGEYTGNVRRYGLWGLTCDYAIKYPSMPPFYIDATNAGNEARFINHSYEPNLIAVAADEKGLLHSVFMAKKDISKGQQLSWNYGEDFWLPRDPPQEL